MGNFYLALILTAMSPAIVYYCIVILYNIFKKK
jgi:hypothetical protein